MIHESGQRAFWLRAVQQIPLAATLLSVALVGTFLWWRLAAQYSAAETFWAEPLASSASATRARAAAWIESRKDEGALLASLIGPDGRRTPAFTTAMNSVLGKHGVEAVTLRIGGTGDGTRCVKETLGVVCVPATPKYAIPSTEHAQARRVRPAAGGRSLIPVVTPLGQPPQGGTLTQWFDPELGLLPDLLRIHGTMRIATTTFVRRDGDTAVVLHADSAATPQATQRVLLEELPGLYGRPPVEGELVRGRDIHGTDAIGVAAYLPLLRWHVYRSISRETAFAAFRSEIETEALLAFLLGSFIVGLLVWSLRQRREQEVEAALVQSRLDSLQAQLRPHFMLNALNTISALLHENVDAAERMIVRLGELLRLSLEESAHALIPVRREVALLECFLDLERVRFGEALRVSVHLSKGVSDLLVPRWVLQPLVENAIKHGAAYDRGQANISIAITRSATRLIIAVVDDGPRITESTWSEGVGLSNTRRRLESLFGKDASITLRHPPEGGTEVVLEMPIRSGARGTAAPDPESPRRRLHLASRAQ